MSKQASASSRRRNFLLESESNLAEIMKAMLGQMSSGDVGKMGDMPGMKMPAPATQSPAQKGRP